MFEIAANPPKNLPAGATWSLLVGVLGKDRSEEESETFAGKRLATDLKVPLAWILKRAKISSFQGIGIASIKIVPGIKLELNGKNFRSLDQKSTKEFQIVFLGDSKNIKNPMLISLASVDPSKKSWDIFSADATLNASNAGINILALQGSTLTPLMSGIETTGKFGLRPAKGLSPQGVFVVKNQKIIAQLAGAQLDQEVADKIRATLNADLVFKGTLAAMVDISNKSEAQLDAWLNDSIGKGRTVFIQKNSSMYPVSSNFMKENPDVSRFVRGNASALFTEKVQIISYR